MTNFRPRWQSGNEDEHLDINVIPLIDILLVVLIFITATTTFSQIDQIELLLPQSSSEAVATEGHVLIITHEGQYALNGRVIASEQDSLVQALNHLEPKHELLIYADANARHAFIINALDAAKNAHIERIHFATQRAADEP